MFRVSVESISVPGMITHLLVIRRTPKFLTDAKFSIETLKTERYDHAGPNSILQFASINLVRNQSFIPHIHEEHNRQSLKSNTKECWVVIKGCILSTLYDFDGQELTKIRLKKGDLIFTAFGGHNYKCLSKKAFVYELKSGPYEAELDKKRLNP
jgi:hypothetical protein